MTNMTYNVTRNTAPSSSVYANIITKTKRAQFRNIPFYAYTISCDFWWFYSYIKQETKNYVVYSLTSYQAFCCLKSFELFFQI